MTENTILYSKVIPCWLFLRIKQWMEETIHKVGDWPLYSGTLQLFRNGTSVQIPKMLGITVPGFKVDRKHPGLIVTSFRREKLRGEWGPRLRGRPANIRPRVFLVQWVPLSRGSQNTWPKGHVLGWNFKWGHTFHLSMRCTLVCIVYCKSVSSWISHSVSFLSFFSSVFLLFVLLLFRIKLLGSRAYLVQQSSSDGGTWSPAHKRI